MYHLKEIDNFVHRSFEMYGLNFGDFFNDYVDYEDDEYCSGGHLEEQPLIVDGKINLQLLSQAADALGVTVEAFLNLNKSELRRWYKKYPYFKLRVEFDKAIEHSKNYTYSPEEILLDSIFSEEGTFRPEKYKRYNKNIRNDLKHRLLELLKSYDSVMPGCYHKGSDISQMTIKTRNFVRFEQIEELAESYLLMVSRARELFYQLWDNELSEIEIHEYNFLVSVLGMRDAGYTSSKPIYYKLAKQFAPVYKDEGYKDYASYITYRNKNFPPFFLCKELYNNIGLVKRLAQEFPDFKSNIRNTAILAKNFQCSYVWSDEPEPPIDAEWDEYLIGLLRAFEDDTPSWYNRVFIPKTKEELCGDEKYIDICEHLSSPAAQGGLELVIPEYKQGADTDQISMHRIIARHTGGILYG